MCNSDAHKEGGRRPKRTQRQNFMFKFSCPALKYTFYFIRSLCPVSFSFCSRRLFFSLIVLDMYPFTVINLSCEYNYMLSPVSPSSKSPNLGWFGDVQQNYTHISFLLFISLEILTV